MDFQEFFNFQMKSCDMKITQADLDKMQDKKYTSGRNIQVGDKIVYGIILETDPVTKLPAKMITLHPDEVGTIYEQDEKMTKSQIGIDLPVLKKIK